MKDLKIDLQKHFKVEFYIETNILKAKIDSMNYDFIIDKINYIKRKYNYLIFNIIDNVLIVK